MVKRESTVLLAALIGFCAFSLPLLIHDTRHLWSSPENAPMHTDSPPAPPTWHNYEDDAGQKFRHAVGDGDMPRVQEIYQESLAADPPVDLVTSEHWHGSTPLFEAARSGHLELAKWLVERGASADKSNEWGDTAANEAASMGHWDIVWFLADKGADLSRTTEHAHSTLVLSAVRHRSTDALAELQRRGVKLTQRSWNGGTALHEAARTGDGNVVDWLLTKSTLDINATNEQREGAVHEAASMGHMDVVWKLISAGAELGARGSDAVSGLVFAAVQHDTTDLLALLQKRGILDVEAKSHGRVPLVEAVRQGHTTSVEWLIKAGANVSATTHSGETALAVAAFEDRFPILWRLHEGGASIFATNEYGGTALMSAAHFGHELEAKRLISLGLDVNAANHRGDTALTLACSRDDLPLVETLIKLGATAEQRGSRRDTPLIRAARFRRVDTTRYLLERKAVEVDAANKRGDTALIEACRSGSVDVAKLLVEHGASVAHANRAGNTPLLDAAESGNPELVKWLLEQPGIDVHAKNRHGDGAIELSQWGRESETVGGLLKAKGVVAVLHDYDNREHHDGEHDANQNH